MCKRHHKSVSKEPVNQKDPVKKEKQKVKVLKLGDALEQVQLEQETTSQTNFKPKYRFYLNISNYCYIVWITQFVQFVWMKLLIKM